MFSQNLKPEQTTFESNVILLLLSQSRINQPAFFNLLELVSLFVNCRICGSPPTLLYCGGGGYRRGGIFPLDMVRSKSNLFRVQEKKERGCRRSGCFYAGGRKEVNVFCVLALSWGLKVF